MKLLDSLLDALVRLEGDALVMHVGEKPYVVTTSAAMSAYRGPLAWGQVELSSRVLTSEAVQGMLGQILPAEQRQALDEFGAIEHEIPGPRDVSDRFTVVAARGGDDIWLELRRRPVEAQPEAAQEPETVEREAVEEQPAMVVGSAAATDAAATAPQDASAMPAASHDVVSAGIPPAEPPAEPSPGRAADEDEIEERVPVLDEVSQHEPAHVEHMVISLGGHGEPEQVPLDSVPTDAIELIEDEAQGTPSDDEVDAMLAATASALLASDLEEFEETESGASEVSQAEAIAPVVAEPAPERAEEALTPPEPIPEPISESISESILEEPVEEAPATLDVRSDEPAADDDAHLPAEVVEPVHAPEGPETPTSDIYAFETEASPEPRTPVSEPLPGLPSEPVSVSTAAHAATSHATPPTVVVPLSRAASKADAGAAAGGTALHNALRAAGARGASTMYLVAQSRPVIRVDGEVIVLEDAGVLSAAEIERLIADLAPPQRRPGLAEDETEWMSDVPGVGRVRCLTFRDHRGPGVIFRMDHAGLSPEVKALCAQPDGLVLIAGPHASGKSTLLNALVDQINVTRGDHVIMLQSQIGFVHESRRSFISQREFGPDPAQVAAAARRALREDPDVLVIEDLRSADLVTVALEAAESGRLVFGTVPAPSAVAAIEQMLDTARVERRGSTARSLAGALRGVVSQVIVRRASGGRVPAREVLLNTPAVAGIIRNGDLAQLPASFGQSRTPGMVSITDSLVALVRSGAVLPAEAYRKAPDRSALLTRLAQEGVDTTFADTVL